MENREKQTTSESEATTAQNPIDSSTYNRRNDRKPTSPQERSPEGSPAASSASSLHSRQTSPTLSHGFSPTEEKVTENPPAKPPPPPVAVVNRSVRDESTGVTKKADPGVGEGFFGGVVEEGGGGGGGQRLRPSLSILRRIKRDKMVKKAALGFRVFGLLFCLISFSVMAADKNQGWAVDSFYRYKEFRYCMSVNVIGFVYSGAQAYDLAYHLGTGKYVVRHQLRYYFDFAIDQMLAYLLISASSSATTRVDDWVSNWGNDKFPQMGTASVAMSFLAFVALAFSSLISGCTLCTSVSM